MSRLQPIPMPTAFISPVRARYDEETNRPADLEGYPCPTCFHPHLVTGPRGVPGDRRPMLGQAGSVSWKPAKSP